MTRLEQAQKIQEAINVLRHEVADMKKDGRGPGERAMQIVITDLEKVEAYWTYYVMAWVTREVDAKVEDDGGLRNPG